MYIRGSFDGKATFPWEECRSSAGSDDGHAWKPISRNCSKGEIVNLKFDDIKFMSILHVQFNSHEWIDDWLFVSLTKSSLLLNCCCIVCAVGIVLMRIIFHEIGAK